MRTINILVTVLLCLVFTSLTKAQALDVKVSLKYKNVTVEEILKDISKKYNVNFSYSNNVIPLKKKISLTVTERSLKYALSQIFKDTDVSYEELESQVVLKKAPKKKISGQNEKSLNIPSEKETVVSKDTTTKIADEVTRKEEANNVYASEDTLIYFAEPQYKELKLLDTLDKVTLRKQYLADKRKLRKQYYKKMDSLEQSGVPNSKNNLDADFKRVMRKLRNKVNAIQDSLENINIYSKDTTDINNIDTTHNSNHKVADSSEYIHRPAQVTFVTPLGTNGMESWKVVNNISLNILAGAAAGLEGFEFGSLLNVEKDYVRGAQFSGLGNVVGDRVTGLQFSGLFNINGGYSEGALFSGFMNVVADSVFAVQGAGFTNVVSGDCEGVQAAGFANIANGNMYGVQGAGFLNFARKEVAGGQVAGFMNVAGGNVYGPQVSGFMNVAPDTLRGVQVTGFMNVANEVKGSQIGFINFADSVTGVQIGFLSFARRGYRRVEIWGSEALYANIAFKTGTSHFYNILAAGAQAKGSVISWAYGYGVGTEIKLSKKLLVNLDLLSFHIHENEVHWEKLNLLNQFRPTFGVLLGRKASIFAGPVLNVMVSNQYHPDTNTYGSSLSPDWSFFNTTYNKTNVTMWVGFNAGIRF